MKRIHILVGKIDAVVSVAPTAPEKTRYHRTPDGKKVLPVQLLVFDRDRSDEKILAPGDVAGNLKDDDPEIDVEIFSGILREIRVDSQTIGITNNRVVLSKFKTIQMSTD